MVRTAEGLIERLESHADLDDEQLSSERFNREATKLLHGELLAEIRTFLAPALPEQGTVVLLVDNLDKSWDRQSGLAELSEFLWGALRAATRLANDLRKLASNGRVQTRVIVFLRTDIYERLRSLARESDKLPASWLLWNDHELLFRVIEERLVSSQSDDSEPQEIWDRFFSSPIGSESAKEFFLSQSLPKPRDLLYLVKEAVSQAINHGNGEVSERDAKGAARGYSEFAYDVLRIEDASSEHGVADALIELTGGPAQLTLGGLVGALKKGGAVFEDEAAELEAIRRLVLFGFVQPQVGPNDFRTVERLSELDKALALARRHSESIGGDICFQVHRAFRPFLELKETS